MGSRLPAFNNAELTVSKGTLYWGHRVVLPNGDRNFALKELLDTHAGITAVKNLARSIFWYPRLDNDIEMLAKRCPQCVQCFPMSPAQVPVNWAKDNARWYRLRMDLAGVVEGYMILVLVDTETKWIEAVTMKTATAETKVDVLRGIFARFGPPGTVVSDNGLQLTSVDTARFFPENEPFETPATIEHSSPEGPFFSANDQTTSSDVRQAGQFVLSEPVVGGGIEPAVSGPTKPIQLRRSARASKPPDRF
ncbi:hypothetical protein MRX96_057155 [Rhipicephalus microplus]